MGGFVSLALSEYVIEIKAYEVSQEWRACQCQLHGRSRRSCHMP